MAPWLATLLCATAVWNASWGDRRCAGNSNRGLRGPAHRTSRAPVMARLHGQGHQRHCCSKRIDPHCCSCPSLRDSVACTARARARGLPPQLLAPANSGSSHAVSSESSIDAVYLSASPAQHGAHGGAEVCAGCVRRNLRCARPRWVLLHGRASSRLPGHLRGAARAPQVMATRVRERMSAPRRARGREPAARDGTGRVGRPATRAGVLDLRPRRPRDGRDGIQAACP